MAAHFQFPPGMENVAAYLAQLFAAASQAQQAQQQAIPTFRAEEWYLQTTYSGLPSESLEQFFASIVDQVLVMSNGNRELPPQFETPLVHRIGSLLRGNARQVYEAWLRDCQAQGEIVSFAGLQHVLRESFGKVEAVRRREARAQLAGLRMRGGDFARVFLDARRLMSEAEIAEDEVLFHVVRAVSVEPMFNLALTMAVPEPTTLNDAYPVLQRVSLGLKRERQADGAPGSVGGGGAAASFAGKCHNCGKKGHKALDCHSAPRKPWVEASRLDSARESAASGSSAATSSGGARPAAGAAAGIKCFNCHKFGHRKADCKLPPQKYGGGSGGQVTLGVAEDDDDDGDDQKWKCQYFHFVVNSNTATLPALIDTGASDSLVAESVVTKLGDDVEYLEDKPFKIMTADRGVSLSGFRRVRLLLTLPDKGLRVAHVFRVVAALSQSLVLGQDFIGRHKLQYSAETASWSFPVCSSVSMAKQTQCVSLAIRQAFEERAGNEDDVLARLMDGLSGSALVWGIDQTLRGCVDELCNEVAARSESADGDDDVGMVVAAERQRQTTQHYGSLKPGDVIDGSALLGPGVDEDEGEGFLNAAGNLRLPVPDEGSSGALYGVTLGKDARLRDVVKKWGARGVFYTSPEQFKKPAKVPPLVLRLKPDAKPKFQHNYRTSIHADGAMANELNGLKEKTVVECLPEGERPEWCSPIFALPKPDGSCRMIEDLRYVNSQLEMDNGADMPLMDDLLQRMQGKRVFFKSDIKFAYYSVPLEEGSRNLTTFALGGRLHRWTRMSLGLKTAPLHFATVMRGVLAPLEGMAVGSFFDDVSGGAESDDELLVLVDKFFECIHNAGMVVSGPKTVLGVREIDVVGVTLSAAGYRPIASKIAAVASRPPPVNVKSLSRALGAFTFYRRWIASFAEIAKPLFDLMKHDTPWVWGEAQQRAFDTLKAALTSAPLLTLADPKRGFTLYTDASGVAIAGILCQTLDDGREHVVEYYSRLLRDPEVRYGASEQEALAVCESLDKFRVYLLGAPGGVTVVTDARCLLWLSSVRDPSSRLLRWALRIQSYNVKIVHRPGTSQRHVDWLSRPDTETLGDGSCAVGVLRPAQALVVTRAAAARGGEREERKEAKSKERKEAKSVVRKEAESKERVGAESVARGAAEATDEARDEGARGVPTGDEADRNDVVSGDVCRNAEGVVEYLGSDPTEYMALLHYLRFGRHRAAETKSNVRRVQAMAPMFRWDSDVGELLRRDNERSDVWRVVPRCTERAQLIRDAHELGHGGATTTYERLAARYWWPKMRVQVDKAVSGCVTCLRTRPMRVVREPARTLPVVGVFARIQVDCMFGLPENEEGYKGILVAMDSCSKFPEAWGIRSKTAKEIAWVLWAGWFTRYGPPEVVLSDRAAELRGGLLSELARLCGTERLQTSAMHPSTNGLVERFNSTLTTLLRALCVDNPTAWPRMLPLALWAYRSRRHSVVKHSPYFMVFGREAPELMRRREAATSAGGAVPVGGGGEQARELTEAELEAAMTEESAATELEALRGRLRELEEHASTTAEVLRDLVVSREAQRRAQDAQNYVDVTPLQPGTKVMLRKEGGNMAKTKLDAKADGPYVVVKQHAGGNYSLAGGDGRQLQARFARDKLRPVGDDVPLTTASEARGRGRPRGRRTNAVSDGGNDDE